MSTQDILSELPRLSVAERELVAKALRDLSISRETLPESPVSKPRMAGLHTGAWEVMPDFDAPLPEKFWFGEEA